MMKNTFFADVNELISYLYTKVDHLSPLKLQKGLYFLYAYYSAMYGTKGDESSEVDYNLPPELFPAQFEAWNYGPVIRSVYDDRKFGEKKYQELAQTFNAKTAFVGNEGIEVRSFIDDLFGQINKASDFSLVDRSHADKAWEEAFSQGKSTTIPNQAIINEYKAKFARR